MCCSLKGLDAIVLLWDDSEGASASRRLEPCREGGGNWQVAWRRSMARGVVLMRVLVAGVFVMMFIFLAIGVPGEAGGAEFSREYLGGGSSGGARYACTPSLPYDLLAACDIPCPGGTCDIRVIDDVRGSAIGFRVCFDGETFCRPEGYWSEAHVAGWEVTVVPDLFEATKGIVIVT